MQPTNYTDRYREYDTRPTAPDSFRFPGSTPERERVRRVTSHAPRITATADEVREQQINSARQNAYDKFQQQEHLHISPEEAAAWAQWILQASMVLEGLRHEVVGSK
jgi:hypothetical protein